MNRLTAAQVDQLLKPINHARVMKDGKGHSHVSQQDVTAHLIRCFGFGNFDTEVLAIECLFEHNRADDKGAPSKRWDVGYRCLMRLTIKASDGTVIARYEDGATATAQNQTLGDAHDLAYKSSISLAKKRCAINLGDQFGLSLYNKGQESALVMGTLIRPHHEGQPAHHVDVQEGVSRQLAMGNDETDYDAEPEKRATRVKAKDINPAEDPWAVKPDEEKP